jgi:hypothetical protein
VGDESVNAAVADAVVDDADLRQFDPVADAVLVVLAGRVIPSLAPTVSIDVQFAHGAEGNDRRAPGAGKGWNDEHRVSAFRNYRGGHI